MLGKNRCRQQNRSHYSHATSESSNNARRHPCHVADDYYRGRWAIGVAMVLFLCTMMGYISRSTISVALPFISDDYGWTAAEEGLWGGILLGIFLIGYGFSNILFSPLIDRYGPRKALIVAIAIWSLITAVTGLIGLIFGAFLVLRLMLGLSQGVLFPSASKVARVHFAPKLRSRVNGLYMSSMFLSNLVIGLVMLPLIQGTNWQFALYMAALTGFVLVVIVWFMLEDEDGLIVQHKGLRESYREVSKGLSNAAKIRGFWRITLADGAMNLAWWGLSLWLPTYLISAKGFTLDELIWALPIIYIGGFIGIFFGSWISDRIGRRSEITAIFSIAGALALMLLVFPTSKQMDVAACFLVFFFISLLPANAYTLLQGITPRNVTGTATGLLNGLSNGLGVFGPVLIGISVALTDSFFSGIVVMAVAQLVAAWAMFSFRKLENHGSED
ncbi:MAG TPA: MFS transporter [Methanomassiliicoccales archaeon]|nr:MFS transporter [Methanomassiliicoccales archaeon]